MGNSSLDTNVHVSAKNTRVILVGIGGATCSGKTTLAKHLRRVLPNSVILHQDDFAPPQELVPMHPVYKVQDWDAPSGAIQWPRMISFLKHIKETGEIPPEHRSHDHLNKQKLVHMSDEVRDAWHSTFESIQAKAEEKGENIIWGLVDGFLLYWHPEVYEELDVKIMLRVPQAVLKQRRHERHGYHTAEGSLWRDPPEYWEQIVWPAYLEANQDVFADRDVEHGGPSGKVQDIIIINGTEIDMGGIVERCCGVLKQKIEETI